MKLKKNSWYLVTMLSLLSIQFGCQKKLNDPVPEDSLYYPLQIGNYWIYQVTLEKYTGTNLSTSVSYQLQKKISTSHLQNGQEVYLVEESARQTGQSSWKLIGIHTVYKSLSEVVSQENNIPIIILAFPITVTTSWNTNSYNSTADTLLHYRNIGHSFSVGKLFFDKTTSVVGENDSTLVDQTKYRRVYAQNIGLIYRESVSLAFCQSSASCVNKGIIESGTKLKWELVDSNRLD